MSLYDINSLKHHSLHTNEGHIVTRPTYKIDQNRLRREREESTLTQAEVAEKMRSILKTAKATGDSSILRSYQRIEKTGKTSKARAAALAEVFGISVEILQGGEIPEDSADFVSRVEQQIKAQKKAGNNPMLLRAFEHHQQTYSSPVSEDDCIRDFAEDIGAQIEFAQIGQDAREIARLEELTGWSAEQLQRPGSVHGHWLLLIGIHGSRETEIVLGVSTVQYRIEETFEKWAKWGESDSRITLNCSLPWFHIEISHPRIPARRCKFSFVRCKPEASGLKWVNPTWRDQFWLEQPLTEWAFNKANLVTGFDGKSRPSDVRRLRFRVLESNANHVRERVAYSKGSLDDLPEDVFQNFQAEGNGHFIVINWLATGFAPSFAPYLTAFPRTCWTLRPGNGHIAILLEIPWRLIRQNSDQTYYGGIKYQIDLVEEVSPGVYQTAPWRDSSVTEVCSLLEKRVFETPDADEPIDALQFLSLPGSSD